MHNVDADTAAVNALKLARGNVHAMDTNLVRMQRDGEINVHWGESREPDFHGEVTPTEPMSPPPKKYRLGSTVLMCLKPGVPVVAATSTAGKDRRRHELAVKTQESLFISGDVHGDMEYQMYSDYAVLLEDNPDKLEKVQQAWAAVENRSNVPDDFEGSISFRKELVMPPLMLDFMSGTADRKSVV